MAKLIVNKTGRSKCHQRLLGRLVRVSCVALVLLLWGCSENIVGSAKTSCMERNIHDSTFDKNDNDIIQMLGQPRETETYLMRERGGEYYVELQNTYPTEYDDNLNVPIKEYRWTDETCHTTVWLHQIDGVWRGLDGMSYEHGTEF